MISLKNGNSRSDFMVIPTDWDFDPEKELKDLTEKNLQQSVFERRKKLIKKTEDDLLGQEWRIVYRYYDPQFRDTKLWGKQFPVKGMNKYKTLEQRQEFTRTTIEELTTLIDKEGYNPITEKFLLPEIKGINPDTPLKFALSEAYKMLKCAEGTKEDIEKALAHIQAAAEKLEYHIIPVNQIRIRNCILILEQVRIMKYKKRDADLVILKAEFDAGQHTEKDYHKKRKRLEKYSFGPSSFNHYRAYLLMLFKIIVPLANMQGNPVDNIVKEKEVKRLKEVLTDEQCKAINNYLCENHYTFWRFFSIFYHSGARESEMMRVEPIHVDIPNQRFKALILKGTGYKEEWKPIHGSVLFLWQELLNEAASVKNIDNQPIYLFSRFLIPGLVHIDEANISIAWRRYVKENEELGCPTADFYCLKYMKTTEVRRILGARAAAINNSHTTTEMVESIYDVEREKRRWEAMENLKDIPSSFGVPKNQSLKAIT